MREKTKELLYLLLWTCERIAWPTFRNLTESWEGWAYRKGLLRQLNRLSSRQLVESRKSGKSDQTPAWRLSESGRILALGGRDPIKEWARPWDERWRLVIFDVPLQRNQARERIRQRLRARCFGRLQESVWVSPHSIPTVSNWLPDPGPDGSVRFLQSEPCNGDKHEDIVSAAWDFARINELYSDYMAILKDQPAAPIHDEASANRMHAWMTLERQAWLAVVTLDPLLPDRLLPPDYLGRIAWDARATALNAAANSWTESSSVLRRTPRKRTQREPLRRRGSGS